MVSSAGAYLFGWGLGMGDAVEQCTVAGRAPFTVVTCTQYGQDRAMYLAVGGGLMATGIIMSAIGGKRVAITPTLGGVRVLGKVSF